MINDDRQPHLQVQAYHDGELSPAQAARVEAHLATCARCRDELVALRSLASLLETAPPAPLRLGPDRFAAQVALQLHRRSPSTPALQVLRTGWRLIPAILVGVWLFFQTAFLLTSVITVLLALGIGTETLGAALPAGTTGLRWIGELGSVLPAIIGRLAPQATPAMQAMGSRLARLSFFACAANLILPLGIGLFLWSWLAGWMASRRQRFGAGH